ncbi:lipid kinase [Synechocystis sp. LKSZ1]|uniref:lipid kinase n=1 Tax=Synechocystis sp. LKSZ1 TaxID=3144951 RepID=UPI00336BB843
MSKRALLLINRQARSGQRFFAQVIDTLDNFGFELITVPSQNAQAWPDLIAYHAATVDLVIVGGGDGTLNRVVNSLVDHQLPLGILPLGTANDLARTLQLPYNLPEACRVIAEGHTKKIDLGVVNGHCYFNVASLGLSVDITQKLTQGAKQRWGILAYAITALQVLSQLRLFHATLRYEGQSLRVKTLQIAIGNGRYYGGGLAVAADATIDDQRLDIYSLEVRHWWQVFSLLFHLPRGQQQLLPWVRTIQTDAIQILTSRPRPINTDGELTTQSPAKFSLLPQALSVFVPAPDAPWLRNGY